MSSLVAWNVCLVVVQGKDPVNFPNRPYDKEDICHPASFQDFVQRTQDAASQVNKLRQTSRYSPLTYCQRTKTYGCLPMSTVLF